MSKAESVAYARKGQIGANGIIGAEFDIYTYNSMLGASVSGTAVIVEGLD